MATTTAPQQAAPASPGPMKRIILIVLIAIIAAGAAGAGVWFFMSKRAPAAASAETASAPAPLAAPLFFPLESMTVNLQSDDGQQHFLRIGLTLKLADAKTQQELDRPHARSAQPHPARCCRTSTLTNSRRSKASARSPRNCAR